MDPMRICGQVFAVSFEQLPIPLVVVSPKKGAWNLTDQDAVDELVHLFELDERLTRGSREAVGK